MLIHVEPKNSRAKNRIKEHGSTMKLIKVEGDKFLVQSIEKTWNKNTEHWLGWFTKQEATFIGDTSV